MAFRYATYDSARSCGGASITITSLPESAARQGQARSRPCLHPAEHDVAVFQRSSRPYSSTLMRRPDDGTLHLVSWTVTTRCSRSGTTSRTGTDHEPRVWPRPGLALDGSAQLRRLSPALGIDLFAPAD